MEAGRSEVHAYAQTHSELEASLGCMGTCAPKKEKNKVRGNFPAARIMFTVAFPLSWSHHISFLRGKTSPSQIASKELERGSATPVGGQSKDFPV